MLTLPAMRFCWRSPRRADVDEQRRLVARSGRHALGRDLRAEALGRHRQLRPRLEAVQPVLEIADDVIEADAAEPHRRLVLASRVGDDHDRLLAAQHRAGPRGVLPAEADVDAAGQVRGGELRRIARVEDLRADAPAAPAPDRASAG